jgi:hypothetical protein
MRRLWLGWLAFALVAAQVLGMMHGVVHRPHHEGGNAVRAVAAAGQPAREPIGLARLFGHDEDDAGCRLFDPLNHEVAPPPLATPAPLVIPSLILVTCHGEFIARWVALFDARGPPLPVR